MKKEITIDDLEIGMEVMLKPYEMVKKPMYLGKEYFNRKLKINIISNFANGFQASNDRWYHISAIDYIINDNKMKDKRFPFELTEKQFKKGLEACCNDYYRNDLVNRYGLYIVTYNKALVTETEYKQFRKDATLGYQHEILDEIFGKDEPELPTIKKGTPIWVKDEFHVYWRYGKFHSFEGDKAAISDKDGKVAYAYDQYSLTPPEL